MHSVAFKSYFINLEFNTTAVFTRIDLPLLGNGRDSRGARFLLTFVSVRETVLSRDEMVKLLHTLIQPIVKPFPIAV